MYPSVLLAVADDSLRATLQPILEGGGYAVTVVRDGAAVLDHLRLNLTRKRPHRLVVLLSQVPSAVEGIGVLQAIAADPHLATHHAYVLLAAADSATGLAEETARANTAVTLLPNLPTLRIAVVSIPFEPSVLLTTVTECAATLGMGSAGEGRRD